MTTIWDTILETNTEQANNTDKEERTSNIIQVTELTLNKFAKRSLALPVYSEILQEEIWFCSNESMVQKVKQDNLDAVCYTASELLELIKLNPSAENLKKLHATKTTFDGTLIDHEN